MKRTLLAILLASTAVVWAQQQPPQQGDDDGYAPEHGVARISLMNGDVSVRRGDSGELTEAAVNGPLLTNDHLATGQNGRAEIQLDWGNMIRLGPETEVRMGELEDRHYLVQIAMGTTTFSVLRDSGADVEISTPTVSIRPTGQGSYRVTVFPDGTTEITVRTGRAEIFSPRGTETLNPGRTMEARGTPSDPEYMIVAAIPQDEWDRWNTDRDRALDRTSSYRYVSPDVVGAEDLDSYGQWNNDPEYGNVWVPTVDPGWAPYRVGRWVDEPYYGWTWVSGDPWGWAPYHYGNWYMSSFGWAWYPGALGGRHYWRPALVGFFGWGGGGGLSFGFGNVGWVPLAPHERFRPWYGRGYNNTTIVNVTVNNYRNARFSNGRNGITSVRANDFGRGRINSNNFVRASNNDLSRVGSVQGRLPFNASQEGRRMSDRPVNAQSLPRVNENTRFAQRGNRPSTNNNNRSQATSQGQAPSQFQGQGQGQGQGSARQEQGRQAQIIGQSQGQSPSPIVRGNNQPSNNNGNAGGWRRFEGQSPRSQNAPSNNGSNGNGGNGNNNNSNGNNGYRRFEGSPRNDRPGVPSGVPYTSPAPQVRENFPRPEPQVRQNVPRPEPQVRENYQRPAAPQQQPVRISPPIVRERSMPAAPRSESRAAPSGGGFGTPRAQAPQGGGGGGGGGNRGGGGGGNRGGESRGDGGGHRR